MHRYFHLWRFVFLVKFPVVTHKSTGRVKMPGSNSVFLFHFLILFWQNLSWSAQRWFAVSDVSWLRHRFSLPVVCLIHNDESHIKQVGNTELWIRCSPQGFMVPLHSGIFSLQWSRRSSLDRQTVFWQQLTVIWVAVNWRDSGTCFTPHWFLCRAVWSALTWCRELTSSENKINIDGGGRRWLTQTCLT